VSNYCTRLPSAAEKCSPCLKALAGSMPAIVLSVPVIFMGINEEAYRAHCLIATSCISRSAGSEVEEQV